MILPQRSVEPYVDRYNRHLRDRVPYVSNTLRDRREGAHPHIFIHVRTAGIPLQALSSPSQTPLTPSLDTVASARATD